MIASKEVRRHGERMKVEETMALYRRSNRDTFSIIFISPGQVTRHPVRRMSGCCLLGCSTVSWCLAAKGTGMEISGRPQRESEGNTPGA